MTVLYGHTVSVSYGQDDDYTLVQNSYKYLLKDPFWHGLFPLLRASRYTQLCASCVYVRA